MKGKDLQVCAVYGLRHYPNSALTPAYLLAAERHERVGGYGSRGYAPTRRNAGGYPMLRTMGFDPDLPTDLTLTDSKCAEALATGKTTVKMNGKPLDLWVELYQAVKIEGLWDEVWPAERDRVATAKALAEVKRAVQAQQERDMNAQSERLLGGLPDLKTLPRDYLRGTFAITLEQLTHINDRLGL